MRDQVSVGVPATNRISTDDKRVFKKMIDIREEYNSYQILTKYRVLNRQYPVPELNPLPDHINIRIPNPLPI